MSTRSLRHRLARLDSAGRPLRFIVQCVEADGTADPTDADVRAQAEAFEAEGFVPRLIRICYVNGPAL